jgi:hypothetical protein
MQFVLNAVVALDYSRIAQNYDRINVVLGGEEN